MMKNECYICEILENQHTVNIFLSVNQSSVFGYVVNCLFNTHHSFLKI